MKTVVESLTERPAWKGLEAHFQEVRKLHLRQLFAADDQRGKRMAAEAAGIFLHYSKNRVTPPTIRRLLSLAGESGLPPRVDTPFRRDKSYVTRKPADVPFAVRAAR